MVLSLKAAKNCLMNLVNTLKNLYNAASVDDDQDIPPASQNLNIDEGNFTSSEF